MTDATTQEQVIAFLCRPGTLDAKAPEVVETHASIVFLAGAYAYKLKRAVRYSYLDYSTVERRKAACQAELRVNRAFAPALYLRVEQVSRANDGDLRLGGGGEAVDWLVVMRQFESKAQFDRMAMAGKLTPALMRDLADEIAHFHARATPAPEHGGAAGLGRAVSLTIDNLRLEAGSVLPSASVEIWAGHVQAALTGQADLLERRRTAGSTRACHGDLHLRNICLFDGKPTLFDAIEFDQAISSIDVLYDLAFLLMDLHARGLDGFANLIFNRYLDRLDETDGLAAMPLFLSVRAAIRAQVTATARRVALNAAGRPEMAIEAARYLALAIELLEPRESSLVAIGGLSGTGKSTLAYRLAPHLGRVPGARVLRSDVLRKQLAGVAPESRLPSQFYTQEVHATVYDRLANDALHCLRAGHAVIADAVFDKVAEQASIEATARASGCMFHGLWLTAPFDMLRRRVAGRVDDASDATVGVVDAQAARQVVAPLGWTEIDTRVAIEQVERDVMTAIEPRMPEDRVCA